MPGLDERGRPGDALVGDPDDVRGAARRDRLDADLGPGEQFLQQHDRLPALAARVDREPLQGPERDQELGLVDDLTDEHPGAQVDRLDHQRVADRPRGGPGLLAVGTERVRGPGDAGLGELPPGEVLAAGGLDRLGGGPGQDESVGHPCDLGEVVVAGGEHPVEAQQPVQPLGVREQHCRVVGVDGEDVVRREQRVRAVNGGGAQVVVQVAGEEGEAVAALPQGPRQQPAHGADPALDHQQMRHGSPLRRTRRSVDRQDGNGIRFHFQHAGPHFRRRIR